MPVRTCSESASGCVSLRPQSDLVAVTHGTLDWQRPPDLDATVLVFPNPKSRKAAPEGETDDQRVISQIDLAMHTTLAEVRQFLEAERTPSRKEAYTHLGRTPARFAD